MEMEMLIGSITALIAGGGFGWLLRSNRRKASAEADAAEENAVAQRENRYEATVAFLQTQLSRSGEEMARKTDIIRGLHEDVLSLTKRLHDMELMYVSRRCDKLECTARRPPLPWHGDTEESASALPTAE